MAVHPSGDDRPPDHADPACEECGGRLASRLLAECVAMEATLGAVDVVAGFDPGGERSGVLEVDDHEPVRVEFETVTGTPSADAPGLRVEMRREPAGEHGLLADRATVRFTLVEAAEDAGGVHHLEGEAAVDEAVILFAWESAPSR